MLLSLLRQLVLLVPIAWGLSLIRGVTGIWIAFPIAEALAAIPAAVLLRRQLK